MKALESVTFDILTFYLSLSLVFSEGTCDERAPTVCKRLEVESFSFQLNTQLNHDYLWKYANAVE